jgi:hypothetical protein
MLSLGESFDLFEALAYSFLDELGSALVTALSACQDLIDFLDELLGDAHGYERASTWLASSQFQSPAYG